MPRLTARLERIEKAVGAFDEERYWQAWRDLQPKLKALHRQFLPDRLDAFFEAHHRLHATLPPRPASLQRPGEAEQLRAELSRRLDETAERLEAAYAQGLIGDSYEPIR